MVLATLEEFNVEELEIVREKIEEIETKLLTRGGGKHPPPPGG